MSDQDAGPHRPTMLCATSILNPGPTRLSRPLPGVTLPRTVLLSQLLAGAGGFLVGLLLGVSFNAGLQNSVMVAVVIASVCAFSVTYQPSKGESLFSFAQVWVRAQRKRITYQGLPAQAYVGVCHIDRLEDGECRIMPGAVNVPENSVDERGVFKPGGLQSPRPLLHTRRRAHPEDLGNHSRFA